jgi:hypothetical protein
MIASEARKLLSTRLSVEYILLGGHASHSSQMNHHHYPLASSTLKEIVYIDASSNECQE